MGLSFLDTRRIGATGVEVNLLGMGCVQIGGWPRRRTEAEAEAVLNGVWNRGVRFYDTAPLYGVGMSETRLGRFLQTKPRDDYVLATKVGRLVVDAPDLADQPDEEAFFKGAPAKKWVFDFSYDGVMRSVEESLQRLGVGRIDILHIHDPDDHEDLALKGAYKALDKLRSEGAISAVGAGMNQNPALARFAREADFDCFLLAGRYTLLDHAALSELLPICLERNVAIIIGGVYNSGVLIDPTPQSHFDYNRLDETWREKAIALKVRRVADHETGAYWLSRAQAIKAVCDRHGVPLKAAALQFSAAHPAVASIVVGVGTTAHFADSAELLGLDIPGDMWAELKAARLIAADAPTP